MDKGVVTVEDLESVNGTFLNGRRIRAVETVRPGDRLSLGPVTFLVEYERTPETLEWAKGEIEDVLEEANDDNVPVVEAAAHAGDPSAVQEKEADNRGQPAAEEEDVFVLEEDEDIQSARRRRPERSPQ